MQQFKSMNELVEYLGNLEERVKTLETENTNLRAIQPKTESVNENAIGKAVARMLPQSNLFHPSFWKRSFTVWGHFFVANLIIGTVVGIAYLCLVMVLFGSSFGSLIQQTNP